MTFAQPFSGYEILAKIGAGAMGTVFKARQKKMGRIVALKVLRPSLARNLRYVDRLRREARIVGSLNHPNIVAGFDLGEEGGYHFFVMELVEGNSLKELLAEWGMFPETQVLDVAIQVTEALDHAYQRGIIHRDIKPGNILVDSKNVVKLSDMGLAKGPDDLTLTRDGATVGTPQYISPEQARNPQDVDVRSDLYSLGATIFHMATGSPPFCGKSIGDLIAKVLSEREPWAREVNPLLSEGLNLVIRKLLAKDPDLRYQNPAELLADLRRVHSDEQPNVDPRRLEVPQRSQRSGLLVGVLSAVLISVLWLVWSSRGGSIDAVGLDDVFRNELRNAVAKVQGYRAKLGVVERFATRAQSVEQEQISREKRADLGVDLGQDAKRFLGSYLDQDRIAWLGMPENWRDTEARFYEVLDAEIAQRFGYRFLTLPPTVRADLNPVLQSLLREVESLVSRRDQSFLQGYIAFLQDELEPAVDSFLSENQFVAAVRELNERIGSYVGDEGRPELAQLPTELSRKIGEEMRLRGARLRGRIIRRQGFFAGRMLQEVESDLSKMRARLTERSDPRRLWRDFDGFSAEIARHYPAAESFTTDIVNPWDEIDDKVRRLDRDIHQEIRDLERDLLAEDLLQAYRSLLVEGEAGATIDLLRTRSIGEEGLQEDRRLHVDLLLNAIAMRAFLLETLLGERSVVDLRVRGMSRVRIHSLADGQYQLTQESGEGERAIQLANLDVDRLLRHGGGFEADAATRGLQTGLAFWMYVGGVRRNQALSSLPESSLRRFFVDVLGPLVDDMRGQTSNLESAATTALMALRKAVEGRNLMVAKQVLAEFGSRYDETQVARSNRRNLRQLRQWIESEEVRSSVETRYRRNAPRGAALRVDDALHLELEYSQRWILEGELPQGWSRARDHLAYVEPPQNFSDAAAMPLQLPLLISGERSYELALKIRSLEPNAEGQLLMLRVGDVHTVIAFLPRAAKAFAILRGGPVSGGREALAASLGREIRAFEQSPDLCVEGGIHDLRMKFDLRRERVVVTVELEGSELARRDFPVVGQEHLVLSLGSMHGLALYGVSLREW